MDLEPSSRLERVRNQRRTFWKNIFSTPKLLLFLAISLTIYFASIGMWVKALHGTIYDELILTVLTINIMSVGFFIGVGFANIKIVVTFIKSLITIGFTVWVVLLVQLSSMDQVEQNVWIILCAVFFVYFEVLTDFNALFHEFDHYQSKVIGFLNWEFLKEYS